MVNTATKPVPDLNKLSHSASREIKDLCLIALSKNPKDRFRDAEEFITHLTAAAVGRVPQNARVCRTDVGTPSMAPPSFEDEEKLALDLDRLDTDSLRRHAPRPVEASLAQGRQPPQNQRPSKNDFRGISKSPASRSATTPVGGSSDRYVGPARKKRLIFTFPMFKFILFLGVVGGAAYLVKNSALFGNPETGKTDGSLDIFESESERIVKELHQPAKKDMVTIWVDVNPPDAEIFWNGELKQERPFRVKKEKTPAKVEIVSPGYARKVLVMTPDREQTVRTELEKEKKKKRNRQR